MKNKAATLFTATVVIFDVYLNAAFPHPHVFIDSKIDIIFDSQGLAGFKVNWIFDEMFTSMIINDFDKNQNKYLDKDEIKLIKDEQFTNLSNYNYFTFIKIDEKSFDVKYIQDFYAELIDGKLIYRFYIPCHVTATNDFKRVVVDVYDPSYYVAISFPIENPVSWSEPESFEVIVDVKEDKSTLIYFDQINPWGLFLDFRRNQ